MTFPINGYTPERWLRDFGVSRPNQVLLQQPVPVQDLGCDRPTIGRIDYKFFHIKEWSDGKGKYWYCWHEYDPEKRALSLQPITEDEYNELVQQYNQ
jgi:hypothetical protein